MTTLSQRSFAGGELAPALYSRRDQVKYETGLRACRNFMVQRYGGAANRPGTKYVCEVKTSSKTVRLIPFVFNASQTYVLEFGNLYMRVIKNGAQVLSGGVPYEIATPYVEADLSELYFAQSADVITLVHPNYAPRELSRTSDTSWTLSTISFNPSVSRPTAMTATGSAGSYFFKIRVTALNSDYEESLPAFCAAQNISGITKANPAVVTYAGSNSFFNGDEVYIEGVTGMTEVNGRLFTINNVNTGAKTFELQGVDSTGYTAYSANGTLKNTIFTLGGVTPASPTVAINVSWSAVSGATAYNVYFTAGTTATFVGNDFGFVGTTNVPSFTHIGTAPDYNTQPPVYRDLFGSASNYPSVVNYFQQRRLFANTDNDPETVWASRTSQFKNFTSHPTIQDDDAVTFAMVGRQVNEVRHLLDLGKLIILTSGGEHASAADVLTPTDISLRQYSYNGTSSLRPIVIGNNALYVQARGSIVRDLGFDLQVDGYKGNDLTVFSPHLFEGYGLVDWAYAQTPHSIVWAVREDGTLLGLTYVPEHQVWGWHRHDTLGTFENVCVVPEGDEDALYAVVKRTINGSTKRYVERFYTRQVDADAVEDLVFMDAALSYDGRQVGSVTMTLSGGTTWERGETLTLTASAGTFVDGTGATQTTFVAGDVDNQIHITYGGEVYRCTITDTSGAPTVVSVQVERDVPAGMRNVAQGTWAKAVDSFSGLSHLEGEDVSVFADGFVVANPNVASYDMLTVSGGSITLARPYAVVHVGLPYTSDIETLDMDTVQGETMVDKKKLVNKLTLMVEKSRGGYYGTEAPDDDTVDTDSGLYELKQRTTEGYDDPVALATEAVDITVQGQWNRNGRVFVRQSDPLPLTVLSINPSGYVPVRA